MFGSKLSDPVSNPKSPPLAERVQWEDTPLGMTVHTLPNPNEVVLVDEKRTRAGRWKMLAVLLVCASPVIASYFTYYVIRPEGRRNHGELINLQRNLPSLEVSKLSGEKVSLTSLKGQWLLISVADAACDEACQKHLYFQRQLRESLGKEKDRIDWVWLATGDAPVDDKLMPALSQATVLRVNQQSISEWLQPAAGRQLPEHLYVIDPMGNWMMRFPPGIDLASAAKAKKDLDRLLRASAFWDTPGR
ncbi:MAG: hypothetical protein EXR25_10635 [Limnohabitans sp.]|nr:hypothetical protein [Limnohabitans sp.]